jgi:tetratricopeptide (TPR) repeat protein
MGKKKTALIVGMLGLGAVIVSFVLVHQGNRPHYPAIVRVEDYDLLGTTSNDPRDIPEEAQTEKVERNKGQADAKDAGHEKPAFPHQAKTQSLMALIEKAKMLDQEGRHEEAIEELKKAVNTYQDFEGRNEVIRLIQEYEEYKAKARQGSH